MTKIKTAQAITLALLISLGACTPTHTNKEVISTTAAPAAIGPYSQAVRVENTVYVSGQLPTDPTTNETLNHASIEDQTKLVIKNLEAVLKSRGLALSDIVSTQVFMTDLNEFPRMNTVYGSFFRDLPPARATIGVAKLPRDVKIEISAIAVTK